MVYLGSVRSRLEDFTSLIGYWDRLEMPLPNCVSVFRLAFLLPLIDEGVLGLVINEGVSRCYGGSKFVEITDF